MQRFCPGGLRQGPYHSGKTWKIREKFFHSGKTWRLGEFCQILPGLREICVLLSSVYRSRYNGKFIKIVEVSIVYSVSVLLLSSSILLD